jgi:hypothetical protein
MGISVTPIPRLTTLATPAFLLGNANAAGDAITAVASNSTLLAFDAVLPAVTASASSAGSATVAGRRDHVHASSIAATQAEEEAYSSTVAFTSPGMQKNHPGVAKAQCNITAVGALGPGSYGTASVTDVGTGDRDWVFSVDFDDVYYSVVAMPNSDVTGTRGVSLGVHSVGSIEIFTVDGSTRDDMDTCQVAFGKLEDD